MTPPRRLTREGVEETAREVQLICNIDPDSTPELEGHLENLIFTARDLYDELDKRDEELKRHQNYWRNLPGNKGA